MNPLEYCKKEVLKISYAISALDGAIDDAELAVLRRIAQAFPDFKAGSEETNEMFLEAFAFGDKITTLKRCTRMMNF